MYAIYWVFLFLFCLSSTVQAQVFSDSNLPIVVINTKGAAAIPDEPGIGATMKIIYRGPGLRNYLSDQNTAQYLNYSGNIDIELRGSFSQTLPKKSYGFTTKLPDLLSNDNVRLLGMPDENDWVLNCMNFDPSLLRDYVAFNLSRSMGRYASNTAYCEVVLNGEYKGLFLLQEKVKADKNRVNIEKITPNDNNSTALTGGYIIKSDKTTGGDLVAWYMSSYIGNNDVKFIYSWPDTKIISLPQKNYIKSVFQNLQTACSANNSSALNGFPSIIDIPSFVDYMLMTELCGNSDGYTFSAYYSKDRQGKLTAGPIWDMNLTFGNDLFSEGLNRSKSNVWQFSNGNNEGPRFYRDIFNNTRFRCAMARRWNELTRQGGPLNQQSIESLIDSAVVQITEAIPREEGKWRTIGAHQDTIKAIKNWISQRIPWMSSRLGSFSNCNGDSDIPLVISAINYHPTTTADFPDEDKLEFIRISNIGAATIDLTGLYLGGYGLQYQFPPGASLEGGKDLFLASDASNCMMKYRIKPFGTFSRNLSNADYEIVLYDAFGYPIDRVHYYDKQPWPDADGNGKFLLLADKSLDNSLASSWIAAGEKTLATESASSNSAFQIYPNPATDFLLLQTGVTGMLDVLNVQGQVVGQHILLEGGHQIDVSELQNGIYFLRLQFGSGIAVRSFIKI